MKHFPYTKDLVLIGGGHSHALVLRKWGMMPLAGCRLTVINPGPTAPYSGMLPGFVAGHYTRQELNIDLVKLTRFAGARMIDGAAEAMDLDAKTITVAGRPPIAYDVAAVDIGITSAMPRLKGFADHGVPAKPLGQFAARWDAYRATVKEPRVAVIGGGVAGAELALAMRFALRRDGHDPVVTLVDRSQVLTALGDTARGKMLAALDAQGVTVRANSDVVAVTAKGVVLASGEVIGADFVTGAAGAKPHDWQSQIGLEMTDGFINVDTQLQTSDPSVFAVGDCAHMLASPRPKAGVYAVRQAPVLYDNLRAVLSGGAMRPYVPQKDYLKLISLGDKRALAERFGTARSGALLWKWKNQIDRKFMDQFDDLPQMEHPQVPRTAALGLKEAIGDKPMCGGCGAKVGRGALQDVLSKLTYDDRADVQSIAGDDAAIVRVGGVQQVMTTDHLRSFSHDPVQMTRIAALHALGDIWAMGAAPQAATATLILPRMSADLQQRTMTEIMQAAHGVMHDAGVAIVGGHSSLGDELTVGFTITGTCTKPITLAGAQAGDVLILTKPIGSGTILAAEMAGQANGADVQACFAQMLHEQGAAAAILSGAHAMTDVTGFGLAGHLAGMCAASSVQADVTLADVALMDGALELARAGTRSSLFADNVAGVGAWEGEPSPLNDLMFDPQTAGGLLASIAADQADAILAALHNAGYAQAAIIGRLGAGPPLVRFSG